MRTFVQFTMLLAACGTGAPIPAASPEPAAPPVPGHHEAANATAAYSCPMHPEVKQEGPGACPICGMNLVPVSQGPCRPTTTGRCMAGRWACTAVTTWSTSRPTGSTAYG